MYVDEITLFSSHSSTLATHFYLNNKTQIKPLRTHIYIVTYNSNYIISKLSLSFLRVFSALVCFRH